MRNVANGHCKIGTRWRSSYGSAAAVATIVNPLVSSGKNEWKTVLNKRTNERISTYISDKATYHV